MAEESTPDAPKAVSGQMAGLTVGRVVHFVNDEGREIACQPYGRHFVNFGQHLAATVTAIGNYPQRGSAFLSVLYPGLDCPVAKFEVPYSETNSPGTWHWPERA